MTLKTIKTMRTHFKRKINGVANDSADNGRVFREIRDEENL
jgi:hypothetical protein